MPMIQLPIPETTEQVTRPVMLDIVRQVMLMTGLSLKTNIVYFGDMEKSKQLNSAIGAEGDDPNTFAHNDKISLEVSEVYSPDRITNEAVFRPENLLIFDDGPLNVNMRPVYSMMDATIAIKYRASNKNQAIQWRDYMKSKISQRRDLNIHNVTYSYGVREELMRVLKEIHRLRENVAGYGDTFDKWFDDNRHPKMTVLTNQSGTATMWAMPETQVRVQGWFDWQLPEEPVKDGAGEAVTISFNYKFTYARPTEIAMIYPIMVHNQLLDQKYRDTPLEDQNDVQKVFSEFGRVMNYWEAAKLSDNQITEYGYSIPKFDEFMPESVPIASRRLLTLLFSVDLDKPNEFLTLTSLGQRQIHPDIIAYMKSEHDNLVKPGMCAINVALYRNQFLIDPNPIPLAIDEDLKVTATTPIQLRLQHHLRIGLLTDWDMLRAGALSRLQDHGRAAILMLLAIDPTLYERGYLPVLIGDNFVSKTSLLLAIGNVRTKNQAISPTGMQTVQTCFIETTRDHTA